MYNNFLFQIPCSPGIQSVSHFYFYFSCYTGLGGVNLKAMLDDAAQEVDDNLERGKRLIDINDRMGDRIQVFLEWICYAPCLNKILPLQMENCIILFCLMEYNRLWDFIQEVISMAFSNYFFSFLFLNDNYTKINQNLLAITSSSFFPND